MTFLLFKLEIFIILSIAYWTDSTVIFPDEISWLKHDTGATVIKSYSFINLDNSLSSLESAALNISESIGEFAINKFWENSLIFSIVIVGLPYSILVCEKEINSYKFLIPPWFFAYTKTKLPLVLLNIDSVWIKLLISEIKWTLPSFNFLINSIHRYDRTTAS